jgi:hypothetical protein
MICLLSAARTGRFDFYQSPDPTANRRVRQGRKKIENGHSHHEGCEEHEVKKFESINFRILRALRATTLENFRGSRKFSSRLFSNAYA